MSLSTKYLTDKRSKETSLRKYKDLSPADQAARRKQYERAVQEASRLKIRRG